MKSLILSSMVSLAKKTKDKFSQSKLGALITNITNATGRSWQNSAIIRFLKHDIKGESFIGRIIYAPFTFLEFLSHKLSDKLSDKIERSIICSTARSFVHSFMAMSTRFFGVMLLTSTVIYNILKLYESHTVNKIVLVASVVGAIFIIPDAKVMGYLNGSRLVSFIKACCGVKNISFSFYNEEVTGKRLSLVAAIAGGVLTGAIAFLSPLLGLLVPFGIFGMLLVLEYPVTGVYAAVIVAPLIPFSSMPLAGICIWTTISLALKSIYTKDFKWKREGTGIALVLFLGVLFVSSVFSFARIKSLVVWAMYFVFVTFYFTVINTIKSREQLYGLLRLFVISGAIVALYGVMQYIFGWTTSNAWIDEEMFEEDTMRVFSTLANPNVLGEYLLLVIPPAVVFFLKDKAKSLSKWVYLAIAGVMILCLVLTQSRGCWLGFMACIAVFITFWEGRLWALVPPALCILPFVLPQTVIERLMSIGDMGDSSTSYRVSIWMGATGILKNYLIGGIGMGEGAFSEVYPLFSYNAIVAPHSHNTFIQLLVEGGIGALAIFIAVLVCYFKSANKVYLRDDRKSLDSMMALGLGAGVVGFLVQSMFDYTFYNYRVMAVFFMVLAIGVAMKYIPKEINQEGEAK